MTLRQLWLQVAGKMELQRQLLLSHGWVIGSLFGSKVSQSDIDSFIQYGMASSGKPEPKNAAVDEKVAEILRTGQVRFD